MFLLFLCLFCAVLVEFSRVWGVFTNFRKFWTKMQIENAESLRSPERDSKLARRAKTIRIFRKTLTFGIGG